MGLLDQMEDLYYPAWGFQALRWALRSRDPNWAAAVRTDSLKVHLLDILDKVLVAPYEAAKVADPGL